MGPRLMSALSASAAAGGAMASKLDLTNSRFCLTVQSVGLEGLKSWRLSPDTAPGRQSAVSVECVVPDLLSALTAEEFGLLALI